MIVDQDSMGFAWERGAESLMIHRDLPREVYDGIEAANYSRLKIMHSRSPLHVKETDKKRTKALDLGSIAHIHILEPERAKTDLLVMPKTGPLNTNAGKAALVDALCKGLGVEPPHSSEKAEGKRLDEQIVTLRQIAEARGMTEVSSAQAFAAERMYDSVMKHPYIGAFMSDFDAEATAVAKDAQSGVLCKIRIDAVSRSHAVMVDLKTAQSASAEEFFWSIKRFYYDLQAELYPRIYQRVTGERLPWIWAVVENEKPWACQAFTPSETTRTRGRHRLDEALAMWARCIETGDWTSYQTDVAPI